ncbi:MAG: hypothetical protein Q8O25_10835 [Sulfurisoma sp.]|nr:hypothetical protein [Sulfurisoma sp.]
MGAVTFDTLKYVETLKEAGIPDNQARAQSEALKEVLNAEVAAKHDIKELELKIDARFEKMQGEFTLVKWMIGFNLAMSVSILFKIFS